MQQALPTRQGEVSSVAAKPSQRLAAVIAPSARSAVQVLTEPAVIKWVFAALIALSFVAAVGRAHLRTFWYDEVIGVQVASLPSLTEKWKALADGIDSEPLAYHAFITPFGALPI